MPPNNSNSEISLANGSNHPMNVRVNNGTNQVTAHKFVLPHVEIAATKIKNKANIDMVDNAKEITADVEKVISAQLEVENQLQTYQTNLATKAAALQSQAEAANSSTKDVVKEISNYARDYHKGANDIKSRADASKSSIESRKTMVDDKIGSVDVHENSTVNTVSNVSKPMSETVTEKSSEMNEAHGAMEGVMEGVDSNSKPVVISRQKSETDAAKAAYDSKKMEIETRRGVEVASVQGMNTEPSQETEYSTAKSQLLQTASNYSTSSDAGATGNQQADLATKNSGTAANIELHRAKYDEHLREH